MPPARFRDSTFAEPGYGQVAGQAVGPGAGSRSPVLWPLAPLTCAKRKRPVGDEYVSDGEAEMRAGAEAGREAEAEAERYSYRALNGTLATTRDNLSREENLSRTPGHGIDGQAYASGKRVCETRCSCLFEKKKQAQIGSCHSDGRVIEEGSTKCQRAAPSANFMEEEHPRNVSCECQLLENTSERCQHKDSPCPNTSEKTEAFEALKERTGVHSNLEPPSLSQESSELLREIYTEVMEVVSGSKSLKRKMSRRSMSQSRETDSAAPSSETGTERTKSFAIANAKYRFTILKAADVRFFTKLPSDVEAVVEPIIGSEIPEHRHAKLREIAAELFDRGMQDVTAHVSKKNFVSLLHNALNALKFDNVLLPWKVGWKKELGPVAKRTKFNLAFMRGSNVTGNKQQGGIELGRVLPLQPVHQSSSGQGHISRQPTMPAETFSLPGQSPGDMPPPPPPPSLPPALPVPPVWERLNESLLIKTPCPDISIGPSETALISAIVTKVSVAGLNHQGVEGFLASMQTCTDTSEQSQAEEAVLNIAPTELPSGLVFPFCVVEGKAYSTGRQVFEAQNQTAVSGACALKMQDRLNELVEMAEMAEEANEQAPTAPDSSRQGGRPTRQAANRQEGRGSCPRSLFFSFSTEGPYHELWVHYSHVEDGRVMYGQSLLAICNLMLRASVVDFVFLAEKVMSWGAGPFLESVAERLAILACKTIA